MARGGPPRVMKTALRRACSSEPRVLTSGNGMPVRRRRRFQRSGNETLGSHHLARLASATPEFVAQETFLAHLDAVPTSSNLKF